MKKTVTVLLSCLLVMVLTACDAFTRNSSESLTPMPDNVPTGPVFKTADDVVTALERGGIECVVLRRRANGSGLDCMTEVDGEKVENEVHVLDPKAFSRDEIGDSIASWRTPPRPRTLVAAGNWYIRVLDPLYAPEIAEALDAVVLPPLFPLPDIPGEPRYADLDALADALEASVGCSDRKPEEGTEDVVTCVTEGAEEACARLELHATPAARDEAIRLAISVPELPRYIVTAANWSVQFCDHSTGRTAARELGAAVVVHRGHPGAPAP